MSGHLMLVGAGGLAREALSLASALGHFGTVCAVDDDPGLWGRRIGTAPVIGGLDLAPEYEGHHLVVCAGRGSVRRALVERLLALGVDRERFVRLVHPAVEVPDSCSVGAGSILLAGVVLTADVRVGEHVVVMPNATLTHDDVLDDYATVCAGVALGGGVRVGAGAYLGMNAAVRENLVVGRDATLGMGSVLLRDLPENQTWVGAPARPLRPVRTTVDDLGESA
jgi:sugar O-acyltransferase (sialic acid O-acetyltransferase NeuD family)